MFSIFEIGVLAPITGPARTVELFLYGQVILPDRLSSPTFFFSLFFCSRLRPFGAYSWFRAVYIEPNFSYMM